jgi:hypothetical protein
MGVAMYQQAGMAGLWGTIHLLRIMVNRGLVSPNEVETIYDAMTEASATAIQEWLTLPKDFFSQRSPRFASGRSNGGRAMIPKTEAKRRVKGLRLKPLQQANVHGHFSLLSVSRFFRLRLTARMRLTRFPPRWGAVSQRPRVFEPRA